MQEALNIIQRRKRANIAHRNKAKLERAREISKKKLAPESNIKKRAYAIARKILRKRIAGGRGAEYQALGPTEKEAIDKQLDSRKALIKRIAKRLFPRVKQSEQHRLQSFLKGAAMKNIDEAFEERFASKKTKKKKGETGYVKILDKFTEEQEYETKAYKSLVAKASKHNVDIEVVAEIYNSAFVDYDYVDTNLTEDQFAFARVNHELNELSKDTYKNYINAAYKARQRESAGKKNMVTIMKRKKGEATAVRLLTKKINEGRFIVSGVHQDQGHSKTQIYKADSIEHAKSLFNNDHGDNYNVRKIKKIGFGDHIKEEHTNCGTPDCCGQCQPEPVNEFLLSASILALRNRKKIAAKAKTAFKSKVKNVLTPYPKPEANSRISNKEYLKKREQMVYEELGPENQIGTKALVKKLQKLTPGQEQAQVDEAVDSQKDKIRKLNNKTRRQVKSNAKKLNPFRREVNEATEDGVPYIHFAVLMHHPEKKQHKIIKFSEKHPTSLHVGSEWRLPHQLSMDKSIREHPVVKSHKADGWKETEHGSSMGHKKSDVLQGVYKQIRMNAWKKFSLVEELDLDEACWKGYKQLGMKEKGKRIVPNCVKEDVKSGTTKGVIVPAYVDEFGNTIPAKTVKRKVGKKILRTGNMQDGI